MLHFGSQHSMKIPELQYAKKLRARFRTRTSDPVESDGLLRFNKVAEALI